MNSLREKLRLRRERLEPPATFAAEVAPQNAIPAHQWTLPQQSFRDSGNFNVRSVGQNVFGLPNGLSASTKPGRGPAASGPPLTSDAVQWQPPTSVYHHRPANYGELSPHLPPPSQQPPLHHLARPSFHAAMPTNPSDGAPRLPMYCRPDHSPPHMMPSAAPNWRPPRLPTSRGGPAFQSVSHLVLKLPTSVPSSVAQLADTVAAFLHIHVLQQEPFIEATSGTSALDATSRPPQPTPGLPMDAATIARRLKTHYRSSASFQARALLSHVKVEEALRFLQQHSNPPCVETQTVASLCCVQSVCRESLVEIIQHPLSSRASLSTDSRRNMQLESITHPSEVNLTPNAVVSLKRKRSLGPPINTIHDDPKRFCPTPADALLPSGPESLESLVTAPSAKERELASSSEILRDLLIAPTAKQTLTAKEFQSVGGSQLREFCPHGTAFECSRINKAGAYPCLKVHFRRIILPHTDTSLGDCSYLDTCRHRETCKFVHYELDVQPMSVVRGHLILNDSQKRSAQAPHAIGTVTLRPTDAIPAQWIQCDLRTFDFSILANKVKVLMADPPWDIHMDLPYGTMTDHEMKHLRVDLAQDEGLIFLWVTGRAMELARDCMKIWGYRRVEEIVWVKTNQLQRIIRTGRTGHWLNHSKEHCLVGIKGDPQLNRNIDTDVIVAEVRETSRKPDEIYRIIERMCPSSLKLELFGRQHNTRNNWVTLGNQLDGVQLSDPELIARYGPAATKSSPVEPSQEELSTPGPS